MRLLLDTHVLLWWLGDDPTLSAPIREIIATPTTAIAVSAATAWEIAIKQAIGKLSVPGDLEEQLEANGFTPLPITVHDALAAGNLPRHHDDPFDRMLVAQAQGRGLTIATRDRRFSRYDVALLPV